MKKNKIYVTTMYRFGNREHHSYVHFAGFDKDKAKEEGEKEKKHRGNKYDFEIVEFTPDKSDSRKIIKKTVKMW